MVVLDFHSIRKNNVKINFHTANQVLIMWYTLSATTTSLN